LAPEIARCCVRKVADRLKGQAGDTISFPERPMEVHAIEVHADTTKFRLLGGAAGSIDSSHVKGSAALFSDAPLELERFESRGRLSTNVITISSFGRSLQFLGFYPGAVVSIQFRVRVNHQPRHVHHSNARPSSPRLLLRQQPV
jgi:hypothetical protein